MTTRCLKPPKALLFESAGFWVAAVAVEPGTSAATSSAAVASAAPVPAAVCRLMSGPPRRPPRAARRDRTPGGEVWLAPWLLDRDRLGQVARLVDVVAADLGHLAGEHLQRDGRQQRLQQGGRLRDPDDDVRVGLDVGVALLRDHDGARAAGPHL